MRYGSSSAIGMRSWNAVTAAAAEPNEQNGQSAIRSIRSCSRPAASFIKKMSSCRGRRTASVADSKTMSVAFRPCGANAHGVIVEPIGSKVASGGNPGDSVANSRCEPPDAVDVLRGLAKLAQRHERATGDDHVDRMLGVQLR